MTANEYRAALDRLGLTQTGVAWLFRPDERTSRRWARCERSVQGGVQILIELLLDRTISVRDLEWVEAALCGMPACFVVSWLKRTRGPALPPWRYADTRRR